MFGVGLCQLSRAPDGVPGALVRLVKEVEARASATPGLDLYRLYRTTSPGAEAIGRLGAELSRAEAGTCLLIDRLIKFVINEPDSTRLADAASCDLATFEPHAIACGLKKLLRELPDPLVPSQWYDAFIEASRKSFNSFNSD